MYMLVVWSYCWLSALCVVLCVRFREAHHLPLHLRGYLDCVRVE